MGVPNINCGSTDADVANLLTNDIDEKIENLLLRMQVFYVEAGIEQGIDRGLQHAPGAGFSLFENFTQI